MKARHVVISRVSKLTAALIATAAGLAALRSPVHAASVALGGAFFLGNFHLLRVLVSLLIRPGLGRLARLSSLALLTLKLLLALLLVAGVVYQYPIEPLSFAVGASMLLVAIVLEAVVLGEPVSDTADVEISKS